MAERYKVSPADLELIDRRACEIKRQLRVGSGSQILPSVAAQNLQRVIDRKTISIGAVFPTRIKYGPFDALIEKKQFTTERWGQKIDPLLRVFNIPENGPQHLNLVLAQFSDSVFCKEVKRQLKAVELKPATLVHLLAFVRTYPQLLTENHIIAVGSMHQPREKKYQIVPEAGHFHDGGASQCSLSVHLNHGDGGSVAGPLWLAVLPEGKNPRRVESLCAGSSL